MSDPRGTAIDQAERASSFACEAPDSLRKYSRSPFGVPRRNKRRLVMAKRKHLNQRDPSAVQRAQPNSLRSAATQTFNANAKRSSEVACARSVVCVLSCRF